jgi:prophage DNA circulation protein
MAIVNFGNSNKPENLVGNTTKENAQRFGDVPETNPDQLSLLKECTYNGLAFPILDSGYSCSNRLIEHRYPGKDGARIENTGRNPFEFSIQACFVNTILPGPSESWIQGTLHPTVHDMFLKELLKKEYGIINHPQFGELPVFPSRFSSTVVPDFRGGVIISVQFKETTLDDDNAFVFQSKSTAGTITDVNATGALLDGLFDELNPDPETLGIKRKKSLTQFVNDIRGTLGNIINFLPNALGQINSLIHEIDLLIIDVNTSKRNISEGNPFAGNINFNQFKKNASSVSTNTKNLVTLSEINKNLKVMKRQLFDMKTNINVEPQRTVASYITNNVTTLNQLALLLNNKLTDLISLNLNLLRLRNVPINTEIKYYG